MILSGKSVLANVALPVSPLLFLRLPILAERDAAAAAGADGDGVAVVANRDGFTHRDAAVLVLAVKR